MYQVIFYELQQRAIFNSCELNRSTAILVCFCLLFVIVPLPLLLRLYALQRATKSAVSFAPAFSRLVYPIKGWHWHTIDDNNNAVGASIVFALSQWGIQCESSKALSLFLPSHSPFQFLLREPQPCCNALLVLCTALLWFVIAFATTVAHPVSCAICCWNLLEFNVRCARQGQMLYVWTTTAIERECTLSRISLSPFLLMQHQQKLSFASYISPHWVNI